MMHLTPLDHYVRLGSADSSVNTRMNSHAQLVGWDLGYHLAHRDFFANINHRCCWHSNVLI
jgi:hypothetical protein